MFSHAFAGNIASEFLETLSPDCERIEIVGSLRRFKPTVNDIDLIVIPKLVEKKDETLFGEPVKVNLLDQKLSELCLDQSLLLEANGGKIKRFRKPVGEQTISQPKADAPMVQIDLYLATESTWWTLLLIRTGSRDHNIKLAMRAQELHMQLKADGSGLLSPGGSLIRIESEEDIFKHLRLPFKEPKERN